MNDARHWLESGTNFIDFLQPQFMNFHIKYQNDIRSKNIYDLIKSPSAKTFFWEIISFSFNYLL